MALLPVYEWAGLEDDLTRRQRWLINVSGLVLVVLGAHALGFVDLAGIGSDVLRELSTISQLAVAGLVLLSVFALIHTVTERDLMDMRWVVAAAVGGFFLVDLFYIHPEVFDNAPALFYWAVKPFWVAVPMFLTVWWLKDNTEYDMRLKYTVGAVVGVVVLQLYYTVIPIPTTSGEAIQVGLIGNLTTGVFTHGLSLLLALAVVVLAIQGRVWYGGVR